MQDEFFQDNNSPVLGHCDLNVLLKVANMFLHSSVDWCGQKLLRNN